VSRVHFQYSLRSLLMLPVLVAVLGSVVWVFTEGEKAIARKQALDYMCKQRLYVIRELFREYAERHGDEPRAWSADINGIPSESWRTLLLPLCTDATFVETYPFEHDEAWDSPRNLVLAARAPRFLSCPADGTGRSHGYTSYVAIIHDRDEPEPAILAVVECVDSGIPWTQPKDFTVSEFAELCTVRKGKVGHRGWRGQVRALLPGGTVVVDDNASHFLSELRRLAHDGAITPLHSSEADYWVLGDYGVRDPERWTEWESQGGGGRRE
jgi:hypothetical protein